MRKSPSVTVVLDNGHLATLQQFAKDQGYPSLSSALRRALDEWITLKAEKLLRDQHAHLIDTPASYSVD